MKKHTHTTESLLTKYQSAKTLYEGAFDTNKLALNATLVPYWLTEDCFWYRRKTWHGSEFRLVDAKACSNQAAFDHEVLAAALAEVTGQPVKSDNLPITKVALHLLPLTIQFEAFDKQYSFDAETQQCTLIEATAGQLEDANAEDSPFLATDMFEMPNKPLSGDRLMSPDGKKAVFVRDYNLWLEKHFFPMRLHPLPWVTRPMLKYRHAGLPIRNLY